MKETFPETERLLKTVPGHLSSCPQPVHSHTTTDSIILYHIRIHISARRPGWLSKHVVPGVARQSNKTQIAQAEAITRKVTYCDTHVINTLLTNAREPSAMSVSSYCMQFDCGTHKNPVHFELSSGWVLDPLLRCGCGGCGGLDTLMALSTLKPGVRCLHMEVRVLYTKHRREWVCDTCAVECNKRERVAMNVFDLAASRTPLQLMLYSVCCSHHL